MDEDSLQMLVKEGFSTEIMPTEDLQDVVNFAMDYWVDSGRTLAPNAQVFEAHEVSSGRSIANLLDDLEVPWREEYEASLEWILLDLRASYVTIQAQTLMRQAATEMADADLDSRLDVFTDLIAKGTQLVLTLQDRRTRVNMPEVMRGRVEAYLDRRDQIGMREGLTMGLPAIDNHTNLVRPGELALLAAYAKVGKSYALNRIAYKAWEEGQTGCLYTLENSIEMTLDRIACMATGVNPTMFQRGECHSADVERILDLVEQMESKDHALHILSPEPGGRTPQSMIRMAQVLEADFVIIDQLSHVEHPDARGMRPDIVHTENLRNLRLLCSTGRHVMPCLVAHQINREGKKLADKRGWHEMPDLAETSGAERETDWVFSMYQSNDMFQVSQVLFQVLAARRAGIKWWDMVWRVENGFAAIRGERIPYAES